MYFGKKESINIIDIIEKKLENDKKLNAKAEELEKKYGTLTWKELLQIFPIWK